MEQINNMAIDLIKVFKNSPNQEIFTNKYALCNIVNKTVLKLDNPAAYSHINRYIHRLLLSSSPINYLAMFMVAQVRPIFLDVVMQRETRLKILYVVHLEHFVRKMSRVRFWVMTHLSLREDTCAWFTGPGWPNYDLKKSIQQNILDLGMRFDFIVWYKPLDTVNNFDASITLPSPTCIRYNEMWDVDWTRREIDDSSSNLIICHHKNDYEKYARIYGDDPLKKIVYIPHQASPQIFYNQHCDKDIDILISGVIKARHYPFKARLHALITKHAKGFLRNYVIKTLPHPGYNHDLSFSNRAQKEYAKWINRSKICIACTSKHNYRLGKYVEIPMCGGVICGDLPYEDQDSFKKFVIELNPSMSDAVILQTIVTHLKSPQLLVERSRIGEEWAKQYTTEKYVERMVCHMKAFIKRDTSMGYRLKKIFIISDEIRRDHPEFKNEKWICDTLKQEFSSFFPEATVKDPLEADIIWFLAPWNHSYTPKGYTRTKWLEILNSRPVIFTCHHIDVVKYKKGDYAKTFAFMRKYGNAYHAICVDTYTFLKRLEPNMPLFKKFLWINDKIFRKLPNYQELRQKHGFTKDAYLVGSFQKDTEGSSRNGIQPKLSKGPDIFIKIIEDMKKRNLNIEVVLTGTRRDYLIGELKRIKVKYHYFDMVGLELVNELYCCLDLYIVASRYEGGPRSIFESGILRVPIISTRVGVASDMMAKESIYDMNNYITYRNAVPNVEHLYKNISKLSLAKYLDEFRDCLVNSISDVSSNVQSSNTVISVMERCLNREYNRKVITY